MKNWIQNVKEYTGPPVQPLFTVTKTFISCRVYPSTPPNDQYQPVRERMNKLTDISVRVIVT